MSFRKERLETLDEFAERLRENYVLLRKVLLPSKNLGDLLNKTKKIFHSDLEDIYVKLRCFEEKRVKATSYFLATAYLFYNQEREALEEIRKSLPKCDRLLISAFVTGEEFYSGHIDLYKRRIENKQPHNVTTLGASLYFLPLRRWDPKHQPKKTSEPPEDEEN